MKRNALPARWKSRRFLIGAVAILFGSAFYIAILFSLPPSMKGGDVAVQDGVVNLSAETRNSVISLTGTWEAVIGRHVLPASLSFIEQRYISVPGSIKGVEKMTYRVTVQGLNPEERYALYVTGVAASAQIYANGVFIGTFGRPTEGGDAEAGFVPTLYPNLPRSGKLELAFLVTNNLHERGGLWSEVYFGPQRVLIRYRDRLNLVETLLIGALVTVAIYHLILASIHTGEGSTLIFAVFTLLAAVVAAVAGQRVFLRLLQPPRELPWIRLAYTAVSLAVPTLVAYSERLFPPPRRRKFVPILTSAAAVHVAVVWLVPYALFQQIRVVWYMIIFLVSIYLLYLTISAVKRRECGAAVSLVGFLIFIAFTGNDILFDMRIIHTGYVMSLGLFAFILSQATVIALRYDVMFQELSEFRVRLEETVAQRTEQLQEERNRLRFLALNDELTGLINRRYGTELLTNEVRRFLRYSTSLSVVLVDIDYFKEINDNRGHQVGDDTLQGFAQFLKTTTRSTDIVCRWGGEEFLLILPNTDESEAQNLAYKLQETLAATPLETREGSTLLTFSAGVTGLSESDQDGAADAHTDAILDALLRSADIALYTAKRDGRNLVRGESFHLGRG